MVDQPLVSEKPVERLIAVVKPAEVDYTGVDGEQRHHEQGMYMKTSFLCSNIHRTTSPDISRNCLISPPAVSAFVYAPAPRLSDAAGSW